MPPLFPCHILCSLASFKEPEGQAAGSCSRAAQRRLSGATRGLWPISFTCYCGLQSCSCESNSCVCVYGTQMVFTGATEVAATKKKVPIKYFFFPVCRWLFLAWSSWCFAEKTTKWLDSATKPKQFSKAAENKTLCKCNNSTGWFFCTWFVCVKVVKALEL